MNRHVFRTLAGLSVAGTLWAGTGLAQAQQTVQARVVSATPVKESTGSDVSYNVTYEYNGRQYTTRTSYRPGATIAIQSGGYGVTTAPVQPQSQLQPYPVEADNGNGAQQYSSGGSAWDNVVPEQGVVVGAGAPAPVYAQPAPVYVQPAPVYYDPGYAYSGYPYGYGYGYAPVGISLNLGYSRGWGGGHYRGGGWGGYRGGYGGFRGGFHR